MLRFLNERKKGQSLVWIILSVIVVFGMVAFYAMPGTRYGMNAATGEALPVSESALVAKVDSKEVTAGEYIKGLNAMMQAYSGILKRNGSGGGDMDYNSLKAMGLDKTLLDNFIRRKIVSLEVARLKIEATDDELRNRIQEQFSPDGKWIGYEKYQKYIERSGQTVQDFESALREQIAEEKLRSFVTSAIQISPEEVREQFNRENTSFNMNYVVVEPAKFQDKVTVNDNDLKAYFDANKATFRIDKPARKVEYIYINQEALGKTMQITDDELKKDYDPEKFIAGVKVSQIFIKALSPKDTNTALQKASELVARLRGTTGAQPEDFETVARGNSQDTATKDKGGDLGFVKKEDIKTGSYLQRALSMKVGDISDPIQDGNSFYILKVTEKRNKTFEEAKEALLASSRNRISYKKASELADDAYKQLSEKKDINAVAADVAQKTGLKAEEVLKRTPIFVDGDDLPDIGTNPSFEETTGNLKNAGDVGVKVGIRGGFAVPRLVEKKENFDPTFEEAKTKVEQKYKQDKAKDMANQAAKNILAGAKTPEELKAAAEKEGLKLETKEGYRDGQSLDNFGGIAQLTTSAMALKEGELVKEPVFGNEKYLVFGVTKRTDPDMTKYNEQSKVIQQRLLDDRRQLVFDGYLDGIKKKLKEEKRLTVNKDIIAQIFAKNNTPAN